MANGFSISVEGIPEVKNRLEGIRVSVQKRILKRAMTQALKPLQAAAKIAAPSNLGALGRSIGARIKVYKNVVFGAVGPLSKYKETFVGTFPFAPPSPNTARARVNKPAKYIHLVEKGAAPHFIPAPGYGQKRNSLKIRHAKESGGVPGWQHPGAKAHPFLEGVADRLESIVKGRLSDFISKGIRAEENKARTKNKKFYATDTTGFGQ